MSNEFQDEEASQQALPQEDQAAHAVLEEAAPAEGCAHLSAEARRRVADFQWLHSLLQQTLRDDAQARERRIQRACEAIRREAVVLPAAPTPAPGTPAKRRSWWTPAVVAAAVVVATLIIRWPHERLPTALAAVETSLQEARSSPDRLYNIEAVVMPPLGGEPRQVKARLWVRGDTHYVLRHEGWLGGLSLGSNGREHWVVPPIGPVLVSQDPGFLQSRLLNSPLAIPFVQVTSMLESLKGRYELTLGPEVELPDINGSGTVRCTHVIGRKRPDSPLNLPDTMELWTTRRTNTVYRLVARWQADAQQPGPREIRLQGVALPEALPANWYEHAAHHAADRPVLRRGEGQASAEEV